MAHSSATLNNITILTNDTDPLLSGTYDILGDTVDSFTLQIIDSSLNVVATVSSSVLSAAQGWSFNTGNWSVDLSAVASPVTLAEGEYSINITTVDTALDSVDYNPAGTELTIDTSAEITIDTPTGIAADGYIDRAEKDTHWILSGTTTGVEDGQTVTVTVTDADLNTSTVDAVVSQGQWSALVASQSYLNLDQQVNTYTNSSQWNPSVTGLADGGWLVTWQSYNQDAGVNDYGVYQQRYDVNGATVGNETQINTFGHNHQESPSVTELADGGWLVTWQSNERQDGSDDGIYQQRYDINGATVGNETQVNTFGLHEQSHPSVTELLDGGWLVTWQSTRPDYDTDIYQQRYDVNGATVGNETQVNSYTNSSQWNPSVTVLADGGWLVTWGSSGQDGDRWGIYQQRYDVNGVSVGNETQVNSYNTDSQRYPLVTDLSDGGWLVTWQSRYQDGDDYGIYQQRYDVNGATVGNETQVNSYTTDHQLRPSITDLSDGGWLVTWVSYGQDGDSGGIYQQRYDVNGATVGSETQVNSYTDSSQLAPSVTGLSDGGWLVTWGSDGQDGDSGGIYQRRYTSDGTVAPAIELSTLNDGLLQIDVSVDDVAGNSATAQDTSVSIDTLSVTPVIVGITGDSAGIEGDGHLTQGDIATSVLSGIAEANSTVVLSEAGLGTIATVQASASGQWSINLADTTGLPSITATESSVDLTVTATDNAGNTSDASNPFTIHFDNKASITIDTPTGIAADGYINSTEKNTPLLLSGTATGVEDGQTVTIMVTDTNSTTTTATAVVFGEEWQVVPPYYINHTEVLVNSSTAYSASRPAITSLSDGGYVVTWQSSFQDGSYTGIYAQRYNAVGNAEGTETLINTTTTGYQYHPVIAPLNDGGYVITWFGGFGSPGGVYSQRYDTTSNPVGNETQVSGGSFSDIAALSDGGYVITWSANGSSDGGGVYAQRYDVNGSPVGAETLINTTTTNTQTYSSITALSDGGYVVTWQSDGQDGSYTGIYAQRYDVNGNALGNETLVNTTTEQSQNDPVITALSDGGYVVAWESDFQDGSGLGIYTQRYDATGNTVGGETLVNTTTFADQSFSAVTGLNDGGYVVAWQSIDGIYAQRYDASSNPVGDETLINTTTAPTQASPAITALSDGGYVVAWERFGQDVDDEGGIDSYGYIYAQRFAADGSTLVLVNDSVDLSALADGPLTIDVSVTDVAGNEATAQNTSVVIDTVAPAAPLVDNITGNSQPVMTGSIDTDVSELTVSVDGQTYSLSSDAALTTNGLGQWSLDLSATTQYIEPGSYDVVAVAEDAAGYQTVDASNNELLVTAVDVNLAAPTVDAKSTTNTYAWLGGKYDVADTAEFIVQVDGKSFNSSEDSNLKLFESGRWILQPEGFYHVGTHDVKAISVDSNGVAISDTTVGELTITRDMFAPRVNPAKQIYNNRPAIGGTFDEAATETLTVELDGKVYTLGVDAELTEHASFNNKWVLDLSTLEIPLAKGVYDVIVNTTDANNITLQDASTDELTIGMLAPTVYEMETTNFKPVLRGFYDADFGSGLTVTVHGVIYAGDSYTLGVDSELTTHVNNDNLWVLRPSYALDFGDNDIEVVATDTRGHDTTDITTDEIHLYQVKSQAADGNVLVTEEGNDTITINDNTFTQIDGGAGLDTLVLDGDVINLNFTNIQGIDVVDLNDAASTANTLTLTLDDVLTKTDNSSLSVLGDSADTITLATADNWAASGNQVIDGVTFDGYDSGAANLLIEQGVAVQMV